MVFEKDLVRLSETCVNWQPNHPKHVGFEPTGHGHPMPALCLLIQLFLSGYRHVSNLAQTLYLLMVFGSGARCCSTQECQTMSEQQKNLGTEDMEKRHCLRGPTMYFFFCWSTDGKVLTYAALWVNIFTCITLKGQLHYYLF